MAPQCAFLPGVRTPGQHFSRLLGVVGIQLTPLRPYLWFSVVLDVIRVVSMDW